jgi:hypothetical protein
VTPADPLVVPGAPGVPGAEEERIDAVLIVELQDATLAEWETVTAAIRQAALPLSLASRVRLHGAIHDAAERVMDAFEGRRSE